MKEYIGGFLEFELFAKPGPSYHSEAIGLHNARACVRHVIQQTAMRSVWLPYYTCDALLQPFNDAGIPYHFYAINEALEIDQPPVLAIGEYLVYINYFGLKNTYVHQLVVDHGDNLLVDNTQDYFARGYDAGWSFNSARKSFGVPDGGYLYGPRKQLGNDRVYSINTNYDAAYLIDRLRGAQSQAYEGFISYERTLNSSPRKISELSASLLSQVDYSFVKQCRKNNFKHYHEYLASTNLLSYSLDMANTNDDTVPFCYPLILSGKSHFNRDALYKQGIFIPTLWQDMLGRQSSGFVHERYLVQALLPLPIDHRYGMEEIDKVIQAVTALHNS